MGCYTTKAGVQKDACVMSPSYKDANTFFVFNHVDITIYYHSGSANNNQQAYVGNRLVQARVVPRS